MFNALRQPTVLDIITTITPNQAHDHQKMDHLIKYKEVVEFIKNPPTLSPCLEFAKLRAMQKHMVKVLKQLVCPQSAIHGWSGLVLVPMV